MTGEGKMKVKLGSFLVIAVMVLSGLTAGVSANETNNQINLPEYNVTSAGYLLLPNNNTEWCRVATAGGNLNVRNANGRRVGSLANGTAVYVDTYDGGWARVSVRRRGRLVVVGWVASEYLVC